MEKLSKEYFLKQSLKNYKDLIGKSLKVVHVGSKTYPDGNKHHVSIDRSYIYYLFDIKDYGSESYKYIEYLNGICVSIDFWTEKFDERFDMSTIENLVLDFQNEGEFEKEEFYLIDKKEGLNEIDSYYKNGILKGLLNEE